MTENQEKRFQSIMNKLFHNPKPNSPPNSSNSPNSRNAQGQKRKYAAIESNVGNSNSVQPPPCRPWDRADLTRRLATFKSMTWFAKPKCVDAISCARIGWVNVDMDIIACEVCEARLQFTTPSTWNQQQVEKAALVFSLKLDTGHKLLCPWVGNTCDESLALFPPTPAPVLVEKYVERSSALLKLSALPLISDSAIESMRKPQLEHFLKQSMAVECGTGRKDSTWTDSLAVDVEAVSGDMYYQAHRLLSLCGWEPRSLPYTVDCNDTHNLPGGNTNLIGSSDGTSSEQNSELCVYVPGSDESTKNNVTPGALSSYHVPSSTVLECKLCGASIGLWAFASVPQPLDIVRFVGDSEIGAGNGSTDLPATNHVNTLSASPALNLTIAGGPPPAKQNFKASISLPAIGRNLRSRFSYLSSEVRNTSEEGLESRSTVTEGSNVNRWNGNSSGILDANAIQIGSSSIVGDDVTNDQPMHTLITTSAKGRSGVPADEQKDNGGGDIIETSSQKDFISAAIDKDRHSSDRRMEFHPVRQHRHFCPWVASTDTTAPGWLQTLSALQKERVFSLPDNQGSPSSPSLIRVDDPIMSIRKLFESPPTAKRAKLALTKTGK